MSSSNLPKPPNVCVPAHKNQGKARLQIQITPVSISHSLICFKLHFSAELFLSHSALPKLSWYSRIPHRNTSLLLFMFNLFMFIFPFTCICENVCRRKVKVFLRPVAINTGKAPEGRVLPSCPGNTDNVVAELFPFLLPFENPGNTNVPISKKYVTFKLMLFSQ